MRSKVAVLRVEPGRVLEQIARLCELGGLRQTLSSGSTTILKDNISWHFPFPAANTTPWQLEGTIRALQGAGYRDLVCVQNQTVVTDAFKGEDLNHYVPILQSYGVPIRYNFRPSDMTWVPFTPKAKLHVLDKIFPEGIHIPDFFFGKNIVHLPTVAPHRIRRPRAIKNAFGGPPQPPAPHHRPIARSSICSTQRRFTRACSP
jgi:hypothetical protein